jgi:hypothetical protein
MYREFADTFPDIMTEGYRNENIYECGIIIIQMLRL